MRFINLELTEFAAKTYKNVIKQMMNETATLLDNAIDEELNAKAAFDEARRSGNEELAKECYKVLKAKRVAINDADMRREILETLNNKLA